MRALRHIRHFVPDRRQSLRLSQIVTITRVRDGRAANYPKTAYRPAWIRTMTFGFGDQCATVNTTSLYAEGGIRTLGSVRTSGFQDRRVRPLRHLSIIKKKTFSDHEIRKGHPMQTYRI